MKLPNDLIKATDYSVDFNLAFAICAKIKELGGGENE